MIVPAEPGDTDAGSCDELVAALSQPGFWPHGPQAVERVETHISWVFLAGDRAYKLKKPVRLPFVDASSPARRQHLCAEELRLNRRLAPDVYLDVLPVTRSATGAYSLAGEGQVVDHVVAMRRLPAARMLDVLLDHGEIDNALLDELARVLAGFHERAATGPGVDGHGSPQAVADLVLGNVDELRAWLGAPDKPLSARTLDHLRDWLMAFLRLHGRLLEERVRRGRIREGHGDLHAANVCCTQDGPVLYDCLEFSARLRCADVVADLAFLAMDLDQRGLRAFSRYLCRAYAKASGDAAVLWLIDFYKLHRALVRAKVACLSHDAGATDRARAYLTLATSYTVRPALVLLCGLPATGKSWLARRLAPLLDAVTLRSDIVRKRLAGVAPSTHLAGDALARLYAPERTDETYRSLCRQALDALRRGRSALVDATFSSREQRRHFIDAATRLDFPSVVVHLTCPPETAAARLAKRRHDAREVSDADGDVYARAAERFEPPDEQPPARRVTWASGAGWQTCAQAVSERIILQTRRLRAAEPTEA